MPLPSVLDLDVIKMATAVHHGLFHGLDNQTAELIYQIQLADSAQLMNNDHGENVADPDLEFAVQLAREEVERIRSILRDHQFAELISQGLDPDEAARRLAVVVSPPAETREAEIVPNEEGVHVPNNGQSNTSSAISLSSLLIIIM